MTGNIPELWVLRHGQTEWNTEDRLQGWLDSPLTPTGEAQARAQGAILRRVLPGTVDVFSSPSGRAMRTARLAFEGQDRRLRPEPALREVGLGDWQGRRVDDLRAAGRVPARDRYFWKFEAPGGETLHDLAARVRRFLSGLDRPAVLVTHGLTSRVIRCFALGQPPEALDSLPGGQGVVHHVRNGRSRILTEDGPAPEPLAPGGGLG